MSNFISYLQIKLGLSMLKLLCIIQNFIIVLDSPVRLLMCMEVLPVACALSRKGCNYKLPSTNKNNYCTQQLDFSFMKHHIGNTMV